MITELEFRLERLRASLGDATSAAVPVFRWVQASDSAYTIDFSQSKSPAQVANIAASLVANVACLKDHLKAWCSRNRLPFEGDKLIDSDRDVALVHDLWNRDKHFDLDRSRSGLNPKLADLSQAIEVTPIDGLGPSSVESVIDTYTGETRLRPGPNSRIALVIDGEIVDETGVQLGKLSEVCDRAIAAWARAFASAGAAV